jgi:hypothetical protein
MTSIITGDIINSKKVDPEAWLIVLKDELGKIGTSPSQWEIFRGDGFQVEVRDPLEALIIAIKIKTAIKTIKKIDVRMAIGIGDKTHISDCITECNGTAFIYSGEKFDVLKKKKCNLDINSQWHDFNKEIGLYLKLGLVAMDKWSTSVAKTIKMAIDNPNDSQEVLGEKLGIRQNTISENLNNGYYNEILAINEMYKTKLKLLL